MRALAAVQPSANVVLVRFDCCASCPQNSDEEQRDADTSLLLPPQELPDQQAAADRSHGPHARAGSVNSQDPVSTLSLTSTNRPTMPGRHASSAKRRAYLEYQLDSMHGLEVLGGLRFQTGVDKRLNGGVQTRAPQSAVAHDVYILQVLFFGPAQGVGVREQVVCFQELRGKSLCESIEFCPHIRAIYLTARLCAVVSYAK